MGFPVKWSQEAHENQVIHNLFFIKVPERVEKKCRVIYGNMSKKERDALYVKWMMLFEEHSWLCPMDKILKLFNLGEVEIT